jgi:predicted anti-sigma-YlaC factor YlaD
MIQITHAQAQSYLQTAADRMLASEEKTALESHLENCAICRAYQNDLGKLETALERVMHARWDTVPVHLSMEKTAGRQNKLETFTLRRILPLACAPLLATIVILLAVGLIRWQVLSGKATSLPSATLTATIVPTPSTQLINMNASVSDCAKTIYTVQVGDTLDSIARKFSIPKETLQEANGLKTEQISVSEQLVIQLCDPTPSLSPTTTLTYTVTPPIPITSLTP